MSLWPGGSVPGGIEAAVLDADPVGSEPEFDPYRLGDETASVCTSIPTDDTEARLNALHGGAGFRWRWLARGEFWPGCPSPMPCHKAAETHRHLLFGRQPTALPR